MSRGAFPKPIQLGERAVGWRDSDIEAWIETRPFLLAARSSGAPVPEVPAVRLIASLQTCSKCRPSAGRRHHPVRKTAVSPW
jgi:hypothetical protein